MAVVTLRLPKPLVDAYDALAGEGFSGSRSELMRTALSSYLQGWSVRPIDSQKVEDALNLLRHAALNDWRNPA